jgi:hypothetical protein
MFVRFDHVATFIMPHLRPEYPPEWRLNYMGFDEKKWREWREQQERRDRMRIFGDSPEDRLGRTKDDIERAGQ